MQIEKHINITQVPNGAIVSFGGQVCLTVSKLFENAYAWRASPVFAKLTYGANSFSEVPSSYEMYETMADAVAGGLVALDEMNAFYGVVDIPEDSTLDESAEEFDVENELQSLSESFVVRKVAATRNNPERTMVSAAAVIQRARELAKAAGSKNSQNFIKAAHTEITSLMKAESVEELEEGIIDSVKNSVKQVKRGLQGWGNNMPGGGPADIVKRNKSYSDSTIKTLSHYDKPAGSTEKYPEHSPRGLQKRVLDREMKKRGLTKEEFVQYEDAVADALASIKEDCRTEAMENSDSLIEAHQLSQELFEDIAEEYLNELSNSTLASYKKKAGEYANAADKAAEISFKAGDTALGQRWQNRANKKFGGIIKATNKQFDNDAKNEEVEELDEAQRYTKETGKKYSEQTGQYIGGKNYDKLAAKQGMADLLKKKSIKTEEVEELDEELVKGAKVRFTHPDDADGRSSLVKPFSSRGVFVKHGTDGKVLIKHRSVNSTNFGDTVNVYVHSSHVKLAEEVEELDEAALSGDAYWKAKEAESKEEYLKAQRKALGLPEPVKRGRGKPTLIDRDSLRTRAHSNIEAGKRPTAGFDRNEKIHFVRHLKNHPDFADKHVSQAGRPTGTTNAAKEQKDLTKKKQDTAFSMWAGLGKR